MYAQEILAQRIAHMAKLVAMSKRNSAPELSRLPAVTSGPHRGEKWMTVSEFALWCSEPVATIRDRVYKRHVEVEKLGTARNARIRIASGERERMWKRIGQHTRRAMTRP